MVRELPTTAIWISQDPCLDLIKIIKQETGVVLREFKIKQNATKGFKLNRRCSIPVQAEKRLIYVLNSEITF